MISPSKQKIIQIDVTNACIHKCSHCTRFCGHHNKSFLMKPDFFKKAIDSMEGYPGMVGLMGGEPTLHPNFETLALYMKEKIATPEFVPLQEPVRNFVDYRNRNLQDVDRNKRGLWSSLGKCYYKHFEIIQEVFPYQCINDHMNEGLHQALLIPRGELGVPDEEWFPLRDNCWIQNLWSASITPKGAFFCEVAAALDMLFDGPGGWPVEKGWWKRTPAEFGDQLRWCELCSAPLRVPRLKAKDERDIVSANIYERLKALNSPKLKHNRVVVFNSIEYKPEEFTGNPSENPEWYLPDSDNSTRISGTNVHIFPHDISIYAAPNQPVGTLPRLTESQFVSMNFNDWCVMVRPDTCLPDNFAERIRSVVLNPGYLYFYNPLSRAPNQLAWTQDDAIDKSMLILFNRQAHVLRSQTSLPTDLITTARLWPVTKQIALHNDFDVVQESNTQILENQKSNLMTAHLLSLWKSLTDSTHRIALYGGGKHSQFLLSIIKQESLSAPAFIADDNQEDGTLQGVPLIQSNKVKPGDFDMLFVSSDAHAETMTIKAKQLWPGKLIINPYAYFKSPAFTKRLHKD